MKLYTKTGDNGTSSLYNGERKNKTNIIFDVLGDLDELNCNLGLLKAFYEEEMNSQPIKLYSAPGAGAMFYKHLPGIDSGKYYEWFVLKQNIHDIQCKIMDICSFVATPPYGSKKIKNMEEHLEEWCSKVGFDSENHTFLEVDIDRLQEIVPPIKNFVVPSGNKLIAQIHCVRAICRRCERNLINMYESDPERQKTLGVYEIIDLQVNNVKIYLNRLSDYFFALSRFVAMTLGIEEDIYSRRSLKN
jgi:cob(I)alamin adenosyltransferase